MPSPPSPSPDPGHKPAPTIHVRRMHRRDLNRVWEFLKLVFRDVNRETVEYQRPRSKRRFTEVYEEDGVEQLLFEVNEGDEPSIVGYAECAFEIVGSDNWMNERYFEKREMRPLFVEELAVHPDFHGQGIGSFMLDQVEHLARLRGCTHLVLEVAENNKQALHFYRARSFARLDAAIFLAKKVAFEADLLPPRQLKKPRPPAAAASAPAPGARKPSRPKASDHTPAPPPKASPKASPKAASKAAPKAASKASSKASPEVSPKAPRKPRKTP